MKYGAVRNGVKGATLSQERLDFRVSIFESPGEPGETLQANSSMDMMGKSETQIA